MDEKTYTAPAVIACTDAVQNTKGVQPPGNDGEDGLATAPGGVGFSL